MWEGNRRSRKVHAYIPIPYPCPYAMSGGHVFLAMQLRITPFTVSFEQQYCAPKNFLQITCIELAALLL